MGFSQPSAQELALACGVAGAYVDVTDDLVTDTISGTWGRTSGFADTRPGVLSFDLVNDGGAYTPGNASSSLATKVRIGMGVHHIVDGMHFSGTIRSAQPYFVGPASLAGSARVRIVCDDMLGDAARAEMEALPDAMVRASSPNLWWPLDDSAGSPVAREVVTGAALVLSNDSSPSPALSTVVFGSENAAIPSPGSDLALTADSTGFTAALRSGYLGTFTYDATTVGSWGFWTQVPFTSGVVLAVSIAGGLASFRAEIQSNGLPTIEASPGGSQIAGSRIDGGPHWIMVTSVSSYVSGFWQFAWTLSVDGIVVGTSTATSTLSNATLSDVLRSPSSVRISGSGSSTGASAVFVSTLVHGLTIPDMSTLFRMDEARLLAAIAEVTPEITLDTLPALSTASIGIPATAGAGALDALNLVIRTEQGHVWSETSGTLLAPVQKIKVRQRDRPRTVNAAHTFSVSEILNEPDFTTEIADMVAQATARGPIAEQTAADPNLTPYVGSASDSTTVLLQNEIDLLAWAQDRLLRGAATGVRLVQVTFDALSINRWSDLSALRAGDRIRIDNLPSQLGVSYLDGWVLGCSYTLRYPSLQGEDQMLFTFSLMPVLAATGVYDTAVYDTDIYAF